MREAVAWIRAQPLADTASPPSARYERTSAASAPVASERTAHGAEVTPLVAAPPPPPEANPAVIDAPQSSSTLRTPSAPIVPAVSIAEPAATDAPSPEIPMPAMPAPSVEIGPQEKVFAIQRSLTADELVLFQTKFAQMSPEAQESLLD